MRRRARRTSELLLERPDVEFLGPCARLLIGEVPERLGDRLRLEQVLVLEGGHPGPGVWDVDDAVDIDVGDVDSARAEIARQRLRESPHRELGWSKGDRFGPRLDS